MSPTRTIRLTLNGRPISADVKTHDTLVDLLQRLGLYGARESCGEGVCGCCTALIDGVPVAGCLSLAVLLDGRTVTTIEQLDANGRLTDVQEAFIESGAFQCGYCTTGFVLMAHQLLDRNPDPSEEEIRLFLSGNLCRCGAYPEITKAVQLAARKRRDAAQQALAIS